MNIKQCPKCSAKWCRLSEDAPWQHYWSTGATGSEEDLAGLVCNTLGDANCINPMKGDTSGDSWEKRLDLSGKLEQELDTDNL